MNVAHRITSHGTHSHQTSSSRFTLLKIITGLFETMYINKVLIDVIKIAVSHEGTRIMRREHNTTHRRDMTINATTINEEKKN